MTFVYEILNFQTAERILLAQLADSIDRFADGPLGSLLFGRSCLVGEHSLEIQLERDAPRLGLCRKPIGHIYFYLHKYNFSMRLKAVDSG